MNPYFFIYWLSLYRSTIVFVDEERDQWLVFRVWQQFMLSNFLLGDSSVVCSTLSYWAEFPSRNCSSCQTSSLLSFRKHILNAGPEQSQFWTTMCLLKFSLYCSRSAINAFLDKRCWQDRYHALSFLILDGKWLVEALSRIKSCFPPNKIINKAAKMAPGRTVNVQNNFRGRDMMGSLRKGNDLKYG